MDGMQIALPIVGVIAAAAATFYAVSFAELREVISQLLLPSLYQILSYNFHFAFYYLAQKSFRDLEESEYEDGVYRPSPSSRERRARRQANKNNKT